MIEHRSWVYAPGIIRRWWRRSRWSKPKTVRVMLDHEDFATLVMGEEVVHDGVTIALADIGFHIMSIAVNGAWNHHTRTQI